MGTQRLLDLADNDDVARTGLAIGIPLIIGAHGIAVTRGILMYPAKDVTIGSHFLESLQKAFEERVGLMVPGYNTGRARGASGCFGLSDSIFLAWVGVLVVRTTSSLERANPRIGESD